MIKKAYIFGFLVMLLIESCSTDIGKNVQITAVSPEPTTSAGEHTSQMHAPENLTATAPALTDAGLAKELVCMVNNAYMGKKQYPVQFDDKLYYGCCQMCVKTIQNERQVRVALDPLTGKEVDKSVAFIVLDSANHNGSVLYFESEANYKKYINGSNQS